MSDEQILDVIKSVCGFDSAGVERWRAEALIIGRAVEQASRRMALEEAAKMVGALHEKISAQEIIGFDAWSAGHLALDNAACHILALANGETHE